MGCPAAVKSTPSAPAGRGTRLEFPAMPTIFIRPPTSPRKCPPASRSPTRTGRVPQLGLHPRPAHIDACPRTRRKRRRHLLRAQGALPPGPVVADSRARETRASCTATLHSFSSVSSQRRGHFMKENASGRQFDALGRPPRDALTLDVAQPPEKIVADAGRPSAAANTQIAKRWPPCQRARACSCSAPPAQCLVLFSASRQPAATPTAPPPCAGLTAPVTIERDALGVPTVRGRTRADVARALGFVHAQDRFFQMDLLRRRGKASSPNFLASPRSTTTRPARVYQISRPGHATSATLAPDERALLAAYTDGVNASLHSLPGRRASTRISRTPHRPAAVEARGQRARPLRHDARPAGRWHLRALAHSRCATPTAKVRWIFSRRFSLLTPPGARRRHCAARARAPGQGCRACRQLALSSPAPATPRDELAKAIPPLARSGVSSMLFGRHPKDDVQFASCRAPTRSRYPARTPPPAPPLLADDMHLPLRVPNIWYRAGLVWFDRCYFET